MFSHVTLDRENADEWFHGVSVPQRKLFTAPDPGVEKMVAGWPIGA